MELNEALLSTGFPSLDQVLQGIKLGDNVVLQVDSIDDYLPFVKPYATDALRKKKRLIYFRFARHPQLLPDDSAAEIHRLDPEIGFETFTSEIHRVIGKAGRGTFYLFDCLSDLAADWFSDLMLGNFFMVTCPYLFHWDTVTYFALLRQRHSYHAVASIRDTTQILLDIHRHENKVYVHPLKVWQRYSPTMYLPHVQEGEEFRPVTESATISGIFSALARTGVDSATRTLDLWDRSFLQAQEALEAVQRSDQSLEISEGLLRRLLRMVVTRDERLLELAMKYLSLTDLLEIRKRMIGTGLIGGKSVGMLLARAILKKSDPHWERVLEEHDSFYIGADVFYTYLVKNGCWRLRQKQRDKASFLNNVEEAQRRMLNGEFPDFIRNQFVEMLDYFGQSPIVVRSSSLLEDSFGNAFAGKYESMFCVNQGTPQERLDAFMEAVRKVYASAMSWEALMYRARRDLLDRDEQMALLVQRVSGAVHESMFYPQIAGVGLSFNPYVWSPEIDPEAGMLRLVFGLGTRAVYRSDEDYTRIVALNAPLRRPESNFDEVRESAQRRVDVLDLEKRRLVSRDFDRVVKSASGFPFEIFASKDLELERRARESGQKAPFPYVLTFDYLLKETEFVKDMRGMMGLLRKAYNYPVDIEFTANFLEDRSYRINLVQCRPFQVRGGGQAVDPPEEIPEEEKVLETRGAIIGRSVVTSIDRIIYVPASAYGDLSMSDRYSVARLIGRITHRDEPGEERTTMLLGPGRWGTTTPMLGVPVNFSEIDRASVLCEVVEMSGGVVPDVSLGTHFFNDIVESQILYLALTPGAQDHFLNERLLKELPNRLADLLPQEERWSDAVRVIEASDFPEGKVLYLNVNTLKQRAVCYLGTGAG